MFKLVRIEISCADPQCFRCWKSEGFPLQVSPQLTAVTSRSTPKFGILCIVQIHSSLHKLTSHDDKLLTFSAFWLEIVKVSSRF